MWTAGKSTGTYGRNDAETQEKCQKDWDAAHTTVLNLLYQRHYGKISSLLNLVGAAVSHFISDHSSEETEEPVTQREWHDLFLSVYGVTSWMTTGNIFIMQELTNDVSTYVAEAEKRIKSPIDDQDLLRVYISEWQRFYNQADILPLPFKRVETHKSNCNNPTSLLNQTQNDEKRKIRDMMLETWQSRVFCSISDRLREAALKLVDTDRNGEIFDPRLVIGIRESYVVLDEASENGLQAYQKHFERHFIDDAAAYYKSRASEYLNANGVQSYMAFADQKLEEEEKRGRRFLHQSDESINRHMDAVTRVLVVEFMEQLLAECALLVKTNNIPKLRQLYRLMKRTPTGMETIVNCIDEHIRSEGCGDMRQNSATFSQDPEKYVAALLVLFDRFSKLVRDAFDDDAKMLTTRDKAFEFIVNDTSVFSIDLSSSNQRRSGRQSIESKCPELLANYCDLLLRKTQLSKRLTTEQVDEKLNCLLLLLKYVRNKDVFMRFHKAHLSRRLVLEMSADQEKEEQMVSRLRECGMPAEHVNKLYRMMQDIELNRVMSLDIRNSLRTDHGDIADLVNVKILNTGAWGKGGERIRVSLPREIDELLPPVESFYRKQHNGRRLNWLHHWSTATMSFTTTAGCSYDLDVTTFQLAVLFCWNSRPTASLSMESLKLATQLPDSELCKTLYSLTSFPKLKYQILICEEQENEPVNPRKFTDSTSFRLNHSFKIVKNGREQERGRLSLIGRLQLSVEATAKMEHDEIVALRQLRVQEAIVKVLKTRKELHLRELECELIEMLKPMFVPTKSMMKEQLEWLLENGFVGRKENEMDVFMYIA